MNEIPISLEPLEILNRYVLTRLSLAQSENSVNRTALAARLTELQPVIDRLLPDAQQQFTAQLTDIYSDLGTIEQDLRACEARSDFGTSFVALARAYLDLLSRREGVETEIRQYFDQPIDSK